MNAEMLKANKARFDAQQLAEQQAREEAEAAARARRKRAMKIVVAIMLVIALIAAWFATEPLRAKMSAKKLASEGDLMAAVAALDAIEKPEKVAVEREQYLNQMPMLIRI